MHRIVVAEFLHEVALELLANRSRLVYDPGLHARPADLRAALADSDALIVRNQTWVDPQLLAGTPVRVVGRVGVGMDNLDRPGLREAGIVATYTPGMNAVSVAEYTLGAMLSLSRRFVEVSPRVHDGGWDRQGSIGFELGGKVLGVIGLGDIGSRVARLAKAVGMSLLATDPALTDRSPQVAELGVTLMPLDELLAAADVITLHVPLLDSTRGMIGRRELTLVKPWAYLINSARGQVLDEQALAEALRDRRLAGAALDVRDPEPPGEEDPLAGLPNVLLTPHIAGVTEESMVRVSLHVAEDVLRVLRGEAPQSEVPAQEA